MPADHQADTTEPSPATPQEPFLRINEVFHSIQGESSHAGQRCVFIRLAGCHLRCTYCDTEYAFREGERRTLPDIFEEVLAIDCPLVELTGGEPLLQKTVHLLERQLLDAGRRVLIETSGACDIDACDPRSVVILDLKSPSSGETDRMDWGNLERLRPHHEIKFVIGDRTDYEWARALVREHRLDEKVNCVLMSPVFKQPSGLEIAGAAGLDPRELAEWMLADHLPVRMQLQLHKFIWDPQARGV
ncbi:MAG: 7-carboxy-7-deazaguanine synthase QueE [Phycisphaerales bacterium]|nr:7-carboxy-7-deazaguanine synthase QueE [Phycisphaerales bacterium]